MTTERQITRDELLERGRAAYNARAWSTAVELLLAADREAPLDLDELELLGESAHLVGRDDVAAQAGMRAPSMTSVRRVTARTPSTPVTSRRSSGE